MKKSKNTISKIFDILAKELEKFSEVELADISSGKATIKVDIIKNKSTSEKSIPSDIDYLKVKSDLNSFQSREKGLEYLNQHCKTKKELTALSKIVDIHVQKSDKIDQLKEKIIESTIGFKLRSAAIQNKSIGEEQ
ncbi:MAG: hypothetical protein KKC46_15680 [Proteobacteria bacterium]|nr:hypothetical protein [Pseudomonadota bacterium]